jgi:Zn-dependent peptidase ImmA (M78 family)/transcriptional regulator with XRE-family HTH domain
MSIGERLREIRSTLQLTMDAVGQQTGLGVSTISDFENDKREPRIGQLKHLADLYHRPVAYFLDDSAPPAEVVLWRQRPASPTAELVQAKLVELADQYHTLEVLCGQASNMDLPHCDVAANSFGYPAAAALARRVRNDLGLGDRPGQTLLRILEEVCNVKVFHLDFEPSGTAACTMTDRYGAAILLNRHNVPWRRTFDLAHELFHLLTWRVFRHHEVGASSEPSSSEEKFATCFASNLLMPEEVFREAVDLQRNASSAVSADGLFEVARQFDVSVEAILWRMGFVYNIDSQKISSYLERLGSRMASWDGRDRPMPPERPQRFLALARQALRKGMISTGRYAEYVGISRREAMRVVEEDAEDDVQIEVAHP